MFKIRKWEAGGKKTSLKTGDIVATSDSATDWQPEDPPRRVDGHQWAWPRSPKARGRFLAGLRNGRLRWMRDWGLAANNHPPLRGRCARRGGASGIGNVSVHRYDPVIACRVAVCVDGWLLSLRLPLSLHLCQHGGRAEVRQMAAMILCYYDHFVQPMDNGIS